MNCIFVWMCVVICCVIVCVIVFIIIFFGRIIYVVMSFDVEIVIIGFCINRL